MLSLWCKFQSHINIELADVEELLEPCCSHSCRKQNVCKLGQHISASKQIWVLIRPQLSCSWWRQKCQQQVRSGRLVEQQASVLNLGKVRACFLCFQWLLLYVSMPSTHTFPHSDLDWQNILLHDHHVEYIRCCYLLDCLGWQWSFGYCLRCKDSTKLLCKLAFLTKVLIYYSIVLLNICKYHIFLVLVCCFLIKK